MDPIFSAKATAYIRAAEILERGKIEPGLYDRKVAAAINAEIKAISGRLLDSARRIFLNDRIAEAKQADPVFAINFEQSRKIKKFLNAKKTAEKLLPELLESEKKEREKDEL